jgi:hypothetical protein
LGFGTRKLAIRPEGYLHRTEDLSRHDKRAGIRGQAAMKARTMRPATVDPENIQAKIRGSWAHRHGFLSNKSNPIAFNVLENMS